jgi:hypothetical protein
MAATLSNRRASAFSFAIGLLVGLVVNLANAQPDQSWMPKATEQHKLLQKDTGTWDADVKFWPAEGAEPMQSKGTEKNELLPSGMWIVSRFEGDAGDTPFTGVGTFGYDPTEKKYVATWIDTMTPYMMVSKGDYDPKSKTITMTGKSRDPQTGELYESKNIHRYVDDNNRVFEMHIPGKEGKYWKVMEITYKRRANSTNQ